MSPAGLNMWWRENRDIRPGFWDEEGNLRYCVIWYWGLEVPQCRCLTEQHIKQTSVGAGLPLWDRNRNQSSLPQDRWNRRCGGDLYLCSWRNSGLYHLNTFCSRPVLHLSGNLTHLFKKVTQTLFCCLQGVLNVWQRAHIDCTGNPLVSHLLQQNDDFSSCSVKGLLLAGKDGSLLQIYVVVFQRHTLQLANLER